MNLAAAAKAAVAETFLNRGTAPGNRRVAGMSDTATDTRGKYVQSVEVANGVITITYGHEANTALTNATLGLTPYVTADNSVTWRCGGAGIPGGGSLGTMPGATYAAGTLGSNTQLNKYLPAACRP
jgi:type IV pilus assembly protein PilA